MGSYQMALDCSIENVWRAKAYAYRTVCIALYMFTHVLQVNMRFLHVQTRHILCYIRQVLL